MKVLVISLVLGLVPTLSFANSNCNHLDISDDRYSSCLENELLEPAIESLTNSSTDGAIREVASEKSDSGLEFFEWDGDLSAE